MLKLEDIGKKIRYGTNSGYLRLLGFGPEKYVAIAPPRLRLITEAYEGHSPTNGTDSFWWNDDAFEVLADEIPIYDFSKFGCNAPYVEALVKVLDTRYERKEKENGKENN